MVYTYNKQLLTFSRENRTNQTEAEKRLWLCVRSRQLKGYKFHRQVPITRYILDFYCHEKKLAIELDGSQHANNIYDAKRDEFLKMQGITVLRFWDNEVLGNLSGVLERISKKLEE